MSEHEDIQVVEIPLDEALIQHPEIVIDLGQVLVAAVADEGDHPFGLGLLPAVAERRGHQSAGGGAGDDAFLYAPRPDT